jgi:hypothetical protein
MAAYTVIGEGKCAIGDDVWIHHLEPRTRYSTNENNSCADACTKDPACVAFETWDYPHSWTCQLMTAKPDSSLKDVPDTNWGTLHGMVCFARKCAKGCDTCSTANGLQAPHSCSSCNAGYVLVNKDATNFGQCQEATWKHNQDTNCFPPMDDGSDGMGATDHTCCKRTDAPVVSQTLAQCKSRCNAAANCTAIVYQALETKCWLRHGITEVSNCRSETGFDTYLQACPDVPAESALTGPGKDCPGGTETCLNSNIRYDNLDAAWTQCRQVPGCGYIMKYDVGMYYLRRSDDPNQNARFGIAFECQAVTYHSLGTTGCPGSETKLNAQDDVASTVDDCAALCRATSGCVSFGYRTTKQCHLRAAIFCDANAVYSYYQLA